MSLQTHNRDIPETGPEDTRVDYQRFEHPELDLVNFIPDLESRVPDITGNLYSASVRIYCPDVRVISRIACVFNPRDPNDRANYNLSNLNNTIVAYRCMNVGSRIARVGEIVGKNGIPLVFPKSDIDGIAFQSDDDMPWIDVELSLGWPGVAGKWSVYYHATSNNKMKRMEWQGYISRVTMSVQQSPGTIQYLAGG